VKRVLKLINKIKEELDQVESYVKGRTEAAEILESDSKKDAAFYYDFDKNMYIINDESYSDDLIDKIMNGDVKEGVFAEDAALWKEEESLPALKEGSITKRKDGRWQGRYYDSGNRKCLYASTKKDIIIELNKAVDERNKRDSESVITKSITLNKWIQEFMKLYKSELKEASIKDYESSLIRKTMEHPIGNKPVSKITPMDLDRFFMSIEAPNMRHRTYVLMNGCFSKLQQTKIIKENPFDFTDPIKKPRTKEKEIPTTAELDQFFKYLRTEDYNLYLFARFISVTGLRGGEALALEWSDINDKININKSFNTSSGTISTPKSYASIRMIPLFPEAKQVLSEIQHEHQRIFGSISRWQSARRVSEIASKYGLTKFTLHTLRHYFATQCLNAGIAEKVTTAWLGHHDSKVAKDIYQHIKPDFENEQIEKLTKYRSQKK
jgi:integrase